MRSLIAFIKKELLDYFRSGKLVILGVVFVLFGIMNPLIAKLTPLLFELLSDSLEQSGIQITQTQITALDSWIQFYKNIPMALIIIAVIQSTVFTKEYQSTTLILSLTKGLERYKVIVAKSIVLIGIWTVGYWISYFITYGYNMIYWDNSILSNLGFAAFCFWLLGMFVIALIVFFSTLSKSNVGVLLGAGGVVLAGYLISMLPKIGKYLPSYLINCNGIIVGMDVHDFYPTIIITIIFSIIAFASSIFIFNKKEF